MDRPLDAGEMIAAADRELAGCAHRLVDWVVPMPDSVVAELRARGWMAEPLIFMLHDGRSLPDGDSELVEVDYDAALELREEWYRDDFGADAEMGAFHSQARELAELAGARVIASVRDGRPVGFAQVESRDRGSEVAAVFVKANQRGAGLGRALTARAIRIGAEAAPDVWICADRDDRPRQLYERLGFRAVAELGAAILPARR